MDSITSATLEAAASTLDTLDSSKVGNVHTVTITVDGRTGGALLTVSSTLAEDLLVLIPSHKGE